jgi:hypothetical protein
MLDPFTQRRYTAMLLELRTEHRDLDAAIEVFIRNRPDDELGIKRLKIKDQISVLENLLIPDLNA